MVADLPSSHRVLAVGLARCWLLALSGAMLLATPVLGHQIHVVAHARGAMIQGEAYFRGKIPARNVKVTALDPAGRIIGQTRTDEQGKFTLEAKYRCEHRLIVDTGDGHGAECTVAAGQLPDSLPTRSPATHAHLSPNEGRRSPADNQQLEVIRAEVAALRDELKQYEQRTRIRDVLGGIGYIFGLSGIVFYFLGVRRKRSNRSA